VIAGLAVKQINSYITNIYIRQELLSRGERFLKKKNLYLRFEKLAHA